MTNDAELDRIVLMCKMHDSEGYPYCPQCKRAAAAIDMLRLVIADLRRERVPREPGGWWKVSMMMRRSNFEQRGRRWRLDGPDGAMIILHDTDHEMAKYVVAALNLYDCRPAGDAAPSASKGEG